jgi:hypothetical protein
MMESLSNRFRVGGAEVRYVNGMKKAVKEWKPFLRRLFGYHGCEGHGEYPEEICALLGMISPIKERECLLICNMLRLWFILGDVSRL